MSTLNVQRRDATQKIHKLRQQGQIPMALVGRDHVTELIQSSEVDFQRAIKAIDGLGRVDLAMEDGRSLKAVVREVDKDYVTHRLKHAVLQEVSEDDTVKMDVGVRSVGTPTTVAGGFGTIMQLTDHIKLKGKMSSMPDHIEVDVTNLGLGEHVSAQDVVLPEGVTLVSSPDTTLFSVTTVKEVSLEPDTTPAEPAPSAEEPA